MIPQIEPWIGEEELKEVSEVMNNLKINQDDLFQ